jgi:photosystem II stability/assembly factor-like uncharacterized protein
VGACSGSASFSNDNRTLALSGVSAGCDGRSVSVVARNAIGVSAPSGALLVVGVVPQITQPLLGQTVAVGGAATYTVDATGVPAPTYEWQIIGGPVLAAGPFTVGACSGSASFSNDNRTLALSGVSAGCDGRSVSVVARNAVGTSSASSASLTVNPPGVAPQFTTQPVAQSFTAGGGAAFAAVASGTPAPTLSWRLNGNVLAPASNALLPAAVTPCTGSYSQSGGLLTLSTLSADCDGASVIAQATNSAGSATSNTVQLNLQGAAPPTNLSVISDGPREEGRTVTASVTATGSNLTYQWMLTFDIGATARTIPGANADSYTTPILTRGYNGAALQVRVCSGAQPTGSGPAPNCDFSSLVSPLGQTFEIGAQGACFGGPNGWCYRSPTPQGNDLTGVVLPTDSEPMIAVGYGTVLESNDFGTNWTARFPTPRLDFRSLARVPGSPRLVAPVAAATQPVAVQGGLYFSDDRGATWGDALLVTAPNTVNDVAFAANGTGVAVGTGIWRSSSNGTGWTPVSTAAYSPPESLLRVAMRGGIVLAVSDASNILRSTDGGATWTRVYSGTGERLIDVALDPNSARAIVVAEGRSFVLVSTNDGQTWVQRTVPTVSAQAVGIDTVGTFVLIDSYTNTFASTDLGQNWFTTSQPSPSSITRWRLAVGDGVGGGAIAVGTYGAIIRSGSGTAFYSIGGGSGQAVVITAMETSPAGNLLMVRGGQVGRSVDGGATWTGFGQPGQHVSWVSDSLAFATLTGGGSAQLYRSNDGGANWTEVGNEATDTLFGLSMINSSVGILIGTRAGQWRVFRTTNGAFWEPLPGLPPSGFVPRSVRALDPGPLADPLTAVVLVGGDGGRLLRTENGGQSWTEVSLNLFGTFSSIRHIARIDASTAIAATDDGLYRSNNSGLNWFRVYASTATGSMTSVAADPGGGRCVATGAVGLLVGDCSNFNEFDLPYRGLLRAAAWPTTTNVLAGGTGGTLLINRNEGLPAAPPPPPRVGVFARRAGTATKAPAASQPVVIKPKAARKGPPMATLAPPAVQSVRPASGAASSRPARASQAPDALPQPPLRFGPDRRVRIDSAQELAVPAKRPVERRP